MLLRSIPAAVGGECASLDSTSVLCAHVSGPWGYKLCVVSGSDCCRQERMGCTATSESTIAAFPASPQNTAFPRLGNVTTGPKSFKEHICHLK